MKKDKNIELFNKLTKNINSVNECMVEMKNDPILFMKLMNCANDIDYYNNINENILENIECYNINELKDNIHKYGTNYKKIISNIIYKIEENSSKTNKDNKTGNKTDKNNNMDKNNTTNDEQLNTKSLIKTLKHIIWVSSIEIPSSINLLCEDKHIKLDYINTDDCNYEQKGNDIIIKSESKNIKINKSDCTDTAVIVRKGYKDDNIVILLNLLIDLGITVINNPQAVEISSNKYKTAKLFDEYNIPQPNYILITSDDIHKKDNKEFEAKLKTIYNKLDDDLIYICKILSGHGGVGVFKCRGKNILSILQCLYKLSDNTEILIQEYKEIIDGDIRVNVLTLNGKSKILNVTQRNKISNDFRTNLSLGATLNRNIELSKEQEDLVIKAAGISGLAWAGIDLLPYKKDQNSNKVYTDIIEINAVPGTMSENNSDAKQSEYYQFWSDLIENI